MRRMEPRHGLSAARVFFALRQYIAGDSETQMRRKLVVYCEHCGGADAPVSEFVVFHALSFCSVDCRDDYRTADQAHHEARRAVKDLATVAAVMRREKTAPAKPRRRAA